MSTPENPIAPFTPFLATTINYPEEEDRQRVFLVDQFAQISDVVNDKKIGGYTQDTETQNGNKFIFDDPKKVRNGAQAIARVKSFVNQTIPMPIGDINEQFVITNAYGSASKPPTSVGAGNGDFFTFDSQGNTRIQFTMSDMNIVITTDGTTAAYSGFIVIEYLRDGM